MDKINNISFTGIRNIGNVKFARKSPYGKAISNNLSMVLSNDYNGKDLDEFLNILKKMPKTEFSLINSQGKDVLNLESTQVAGSKWIFVNGYPLKMDDAHLPMYTYLAKLSKKIAGMTDKEMVVNQTYKDYAADEILIYKSKVSEKIGEDNFRKSLDSYFDRGRVRAAAKEFNDFIQKMMKDYFS